MLVYLQLNIKIKIYVSTQFNNVLVNAACRIEKHN